MKRLVIFSINQNLNNAITLLDSLETETYIDTTVAPYYSSIGSHIRHILDFFDCIVTGLDTNNIDLTARKRDEIISTNKEAAKSYIHSLQKTLTSYIDVNTDYLLHVTDHLGLGKATVNYTLESILTHANSHATHHYAIIGYILSQLNIEINISQFGYNPTSPINEKQSI